jgi:hypothetical protein
LLVKFVFDIKRLQTWWNIGEGRLKSLGETVVHAPIAQSTVINAACADKSISILPQVLPQTSHHYAGAPQCGYERRQYGLDTEWTGGAVPLATGPGLAFC